MHQPNATAYVKIDYNEQFDLKIGERGFSRVIYYENDKQLLVYREAKGKKIQLFDLSDYGAKPVEWDFSDQLEDVEDKNLEILKDLKQKDLSSSNYILIKTGTQYVIIVHFDKELKIKKYWKVDTKAQSHIRMLFRHKNIFILTDKKMTTLSHPSADTFDGAPSFKHHTLKHSYTDFAINSAGAYLFIKEGTAILASRTENPEHMSRQEDPNKFVNGKFIYSGFSNFLLKKSKDDKSKPEYYYFFVKSELDPAEPGNAFKHSKMPKPDSEKIEFVEKKHWIFYLYKKEAKIDHIEIYHRGADFGASKMKMDNDSVPLAIGGHYKNSVPKSNLIVAKKDSKTSKFYFGKIYLNFIQAYVRCKNLDKKDRGNFIPDEFKIMIAKVHTIGFTYVLEFRFGLKPWKKFAKKKPDPTKPKFGVLTKIALYSFIGLLSLFLIVCTFCHFRRRKLKKKIDEAQEHEEKGYSGNTDNYTHDDENRLDMSGL